MVIEKIDSVFINGDRIRTATNIEVDRQDYDYYDGYSKKWYHVIAYKPTRFLDDNGELCAKIFWSQLHPGIDITVRIVGLGRNELTDEVCPIDFSYKSKGAVEIYDV